MRLKEKEIRQRRRRLITRTATISSMRLIFFLSIQFISFRIAFALSSSPSSSISAFRTHQPRLLVFSGAARLRISGSVSIKAPFSSCTILSKTELSNSQNSNYDHDEIVNLQYSEFPPPSSASPANHHPVILLHGLLGNKRNFNSIAASLSTQLLKPRPIYTVDLRNHGENTHDWRDTMTYSEMARDVLAFMDRLAEKNEGGDQFSKAILVGHSMGGKVAQSLALMHPDRVAGLVVLDIAPVRYSSDEKGGTWKSVEEIVRSVARLDLEEMGCRTKRDVDAVLRRECMLLEDPALRAFVLTNLDQQRTGNGGEGISESTLKWKIHWEGIVNQLNYIAGFDAHDQPLEEVLSLPSDGNDNTIILVEESSSSAEVLFPAYKYEGDVFIIHGGASRFVRHAHIPTIASFFPNHMLTTIRGAGHWVHAEAPDDTIALLKQYLDR